MKSNPPAHTPYYKSAQPGMASGHRAPIWHERSAIRHRADQSFRGLFSKNKDLPIRGRAQGGDEGNLVLEEQPIDWTYRPADLQGVHGAFAVFVTGDSMEPKYKNQDIAYIHPALNLRRGRYVLVETASHHGLIKQFERWDGDTLVLKQYNPAKTLRIPRAEVRSVMMVIGSLDA